MFTLNCNGKLVMIDKPIIMGIINVTPDSFYPASRFQGVDKILKQAEKMLTEGATFLDVGGQSTRPGSVQVGVEEELNRAIASIESLHRNFPEAIISTDTYYSRVASAAVAAGAGMVNDISGGTLDPALIETVGTLNVPYVCMHIKGTPGTMQLQPSYDHVSKEVLDYFIIRLETCKHAGINDVIIDPGFGFGKNASHNLRLLKDLSIFKIFDRPLMAGLSRKSTVYKTLGITVEESLNGTTVLHTISLLNGANILRVHDVREAAEAIKLVEAYHYA